MFQKINKKLLITFLLIIIIAIIAFIIYLNNRIVDDNSGFTLKSNLKTEVYLYIYIKAHLATYF